MSNSIPADTCDQGVAISPYEFISNNPKSYIHEHLTTLFFIASEFPCNTVLEIGTGMGHSTEAFAEAGCFVQTLDIVDCKQAKELLRQDRLSHLVEYIKKNSLTFTAENHYDIVFIDGLHEYGQVKEELRLFSPAVKKGGFLILHDYTNFAHPGVQRACDEFAASHREYKIYRWFNCNGLYVMKKDGNHTDK